jgi:hypothetical protein
MTNQIKFTKQKTPTIYGKGFKHSNKYRYGKPEIMCFLASVNKCHKIGAAQPIKILKSLLPFEATAFKFPPD